MGSVRQSTGVRHRNGLAILLCGGAAILSLYAAALFRGAHQRAEVPSFSGLIGADGRVLSAQVFDHRYRLVFFGFTQCAAVCPMTLVKVRSVVSTVDPQAAALAPVFVSLDPEHDIPSVLKEYTDAIDPRIVAVTGDSRRIEQVAEAFGVVVVRHPEARGALAVDHSTRLYLIGPDNRLLNSYEADESVSAIASDIALKMRG